MIAQLWSLVFAFLGLQAYGHTSNDLLKLLIKNNLISRGSIVVVAYAEEGAFF